MTIPTPSSWARVRTLGHLYADACQRGYVDYLRLADEIDSFGDVEYDERLEEAKRQHEIAGLQCIVFSGMCFEATIYDYAAIHLGDNYVQEHLDKLDVLSKWVVTLRFISGYELRKDRASYASLKQLISARNRLVHSKSEKMNFQALQDQLEKLNRETLALQQDTHNAFRALVLVSLELDNALGPMANPLPTFSSELLMRPELPAVLESVVSQCRSIVNRRVGD